MKKVLAVLILIVFVYLPLYAFADDQEDKSTYINNSEVKDWKVDSAITYETGDFGTGTTVNTVYVPFTLTRYFEMWNLAGTIPFIYQESGPGVTALGGRPFQTSRRGGPSRSDSGLGDMLLKGTYYVLNENTQPLNINAVGQIKFPTADDTKGLGTGEFDETLGLETSKSLDDYWQFFADFYYTFIGDPAGMDLNNEFAFNLGAGYKVNPETTVSLAYQERTAIVDDRPNPRDLVLEVIHKMDEAISFNGNIDAGLSNGSPDFGITVGMGYLF